MGKVAKFLHFLRICIHVLYDNGIFTCMHELQGEKKPAQGGFFGLPEKLAIIW